MSLESILQSANPGELVTLFRFDCTKIGGQVYFFTPATQTANGGVSFEGVTFGGQYYTPIDVALSGMELNGNGSLPTPKMQISNTNEIIQGVVNSYGDLQGCELRRVRTFRRFLDGQPEADPSAYIGPDVFEVERKSADTPIYIEWELSASIDQEGKQLPGQVVIRDTCMFRYRVYDAAQNAFVYDTINPCPYTGGGFFDRSGNQVTDPAQDSCSFHLKTGCLKRYSPGGPVPFGGFPGAARVKLS